MPLRDQLIAIYQETVARLSGERLVEAALRESAPEGPVRVLAVGKAAFSMLRGAERVLGPLSGLVVAPAGSDQAPTAASWYVSAAPGSGGRPAQLQTGAASALPASGGASALPPTGETSAAPGSAGVSALPPGIEFIVGEHPVPGPGSLLAGDRLLTEAAAMGPHETALILLSGGASAMAEKPADPITLEELAQTTRALLAAGVSISEFNAVRKHLSGLKGGRLAEACNAGHIEVLTLSDVAGDDPAVIGSGPFSPDPSTFAEALSVLGKVSETLPASVRERLEAGARGEVAETPKALIRVRMRILAGPLSLAKTAAQVAAERGWLATSSDTFLGGDVAEVAMRHRKLLEERRAADGTGRRTAGVRQGTAPVGQQTAAAGQDTASAGQDTADTADTAGAGQQTAASMAPHPSSPSLPSAPPRRLRLLAFAAEPTVVLPPNPGLGGRSQQLALLLAPHLAEGTAFLAAGSDGQDGVGRAAGAAVDSQTALHAAALGIDLEQAVRLAKSGSACAALGVALPSRFTGTNLADLHLLVLPDTD